MKIQGNTVGTPMPRANWAQSDPAKSDFILNKPGSIGGESGKDGEDGFSPIVTVSVIDGGHRVTITDANGPVTFDVLNGIQGEPGEPGIPGEKGSDGTSVSHSWNGSVLTVTSASGTSSADLRGPKGESGTAADLAVVATTGSYNDLLDLPTIPSKAEDIGARPSTWIPTSEEVGAVKKTGDTMTGTLAVPSPLSVMGVNYPAVSLKNTSGESISGFVGNNASHRGYIINYALDTNFQEQFYTPAPNEGMTGNQQYQLITSKNPEDGRDLLGMSKKIWSGNWWTGSITVEDVEKYKLFVVRFYDYGNSGATNYSAIGYRIGNTLRAIGGHTNTSFNQFILSMSCSISGTTMSSPYISAFSHVPGGSHNANYDYSISEIWGIL